MAVKNIWLIENLLITLMKTPFFPLEVFNLNIGLLRGKKGRINKTILHFSKYSMKDQIKSRYFRSKLLLPNIFSILIIMGLLTSISNQICEEQSKLPTTPLFQIECSQDEPQWGYSHLGFSGNEDWTIYRGITGNGSREDPFVIANLILGGLSIFNSQSFGIILNCSIGSNGILLQNTSNCVLINNTMNGGPQSSIKLISSENCIISNNTIGGYLGLGIDINSSINCTLSNNYIKKSKISFSTSRKCIIQGNIIYGNQRTALSVLSSTNCNITKNNITFNEQDGINLFSSDSCNVSHNNISENGGFGIKINSLSGYNTIYENWIAKNLEGAIQGEGNNNNIHSNFIIKNYWILASSLGILILSVGLFASLILIRRKIPKSTEKKKEGSKLLIDILLIFLVFNIIIFAVLSIDETNSSFFYQYSFLIELLQWIKLSIVPTFISGLAIHILRYNKSLKIKENTQLIVEKRIEPSIDLEEIEDENQFYIGLEKKLKELESEEKNFF